MNNNYLYDIGFIFAAAIILILLNQLVGYETFGRYPVVIALVSYYCGKYVEKISTRKQQGEKKE